MENYTKLPHIDECRYLILKIVEQAIRDYLSLENSSAPIDRFYYESTCQFLFDDNYIIDYGGDEKTLKDLLDVIDIDLQWLRERVVRLKDKKIKEQRSRRSDDVTIFDFKDEEYTDKD